MKKFFSEFKEFINRGNVVDMAVGIMIGAAFKAIVDSLVNDMISPILGLFIRSDFNDLAVHIFGFDIKIGSLIMSILNFIIIAFILFIIVKAINSLNDLKKKHDGPEPEPKPTTKTCPFCKSTIDINATRCPNCTSELPEEEVKEENKETVDA